MIRSMTGFASIERSFEFGRLSWELRTVNHRYLEYSLRLPEEFRVLEPEVRQVISEYVGRGKVDATLRFAETGSGAGARLKLNHELANRLLEIHGELRTLTGENSPASAMHLLRWPGLVEEQLSDPAPLHKAALEVLAEAAKALQQARQREGAQMAEVVRTRLDGVEDWVGQVRQWLPEIRHALRQKMTDRVTEFELPMDPGRLEQEVAILAQKMDVDEELDRLAAHVAEARRTLEQTEPVGRRLDFLMQEFNRESNTLSSKSVDQRTTQAALELKVLIEQMREQVQNVE
jgi:uncharacterized protein (TIGR00255 family)